MDGIIQKTKEPLGRTRRLFNQQAKSDSAQILSRGLAILWIGNNVERDLLPLIQAVHPCALDLLDCTKTSLPPSSGWMNP
jgi:hypothetical protein